MTGDQPGLRLWVLCDIPGTDPLRTPRRQASCQKEAAAGSLALKGCDRNSASHLGSLSSHWEVCGDVSAGARGERKYAFCLHSASLPPTVHICFWNSSHLTLPLPVTWGGRRFQAYVNSAQNLFTTPKRNGRWVGKLPP